MGFPKQLPRPQDYPARGPEDADLTIDPFGTAAVTNAKYGIDQGGISATGKGHDRDFEANTADVRGNANAGLTVPAKSGSGGEDAQPDGAAGQEPFANARGRIDRGGMTRF